MSVMTRFYNYQSNPDRLNWDAPPYEACNPRPQAMRYYLEQRWGLKYLGCHGDRPIIGGESISDHAFGVAIDMRYQDPGPGLVVTDSEIIPWLIATSGETGLQAIHHYRRSLIWRPPGTSGRPLGSDGWRVQPAGSQMGQTWALWLHLAFHPDYISDGRPITDVLGSGQAPAPGPVVPPVITNPPITPPVLTPGEVSTVDVNVTTIRRGSTGHKVKKAQAIMVANFGQSITIDGNFGAQTDAAVRNVQAFFGLTVDGVVGPKTWGILLNLP
jgi:hypothetical protein